MDLQKDLREIEVALETIGEMLPELLDACYTATYFLETYKDEDLGRKCVADRHVPDPDRLLDIINTTAALLNELVTSVIRLKHVQLYLEKNNEYN
ncbi:hypothetical protein GCK32_019140 [Trichostrongylus colubriformis]|uniref:Uncharacterized protein n=1 Tax=Trichostrongylus colubriformis TaxID=6319 RepID=A0AAN8FUP2_TRICO